MTDQEDTIAEIWKLFRETREQFQETREQLEELREQSREADRCLREQSREADRRLREQSRETERLLREQSLETKRLFQENARQIRELTESSRKTEEELTRLARKSDEGLTRLEDFFIGQWGRLMEALVAPDTVTLFRERGITVSRMYQRAKTALNGQNMEIDILLENDEEVVVLEVKTTLKVRDVRDFLKQLDRFLDFFPKFDGYHVYGGVAALNIEEEADRFAYRRGLFVLGVVGDGLVQILNDSKFKPRDFGAEED